MYPLSASYIMHKSHIRIDGVEGGVLGWTLYIVLPRDLFEEQRLLTSVSHVFTNVVVSVNQ